MRAARAIALLAVAVVALGACRASPPSRRAADATTTTAPSTTSDGAAGAGTGSASGCGPGRDRPDPSGSLAFGDVDRRYTLHIPVGYTGVDPVPLVLNIHGYGSSAGAQLAYSAIGPVADAEGFVVVAPEGQGATPHFTLLGATSSEADDAEFAVALVDELVGRLCIDPRRVYAMGMSNGGALSWVLACRGQGRFAAVGAVAAMIYLPVCDSGQTPVPIVAMMGTADPVVPFAGGRVNCCGNPTIPAATDTMVQFGVRGGCGPDPSEERIGADVIHRRWTGCDGSNAVEFYVIEGGGHTWPGSPVDLEGRGLGTTTKTVEASRVLWDFFARHPG